MISKTLICCLLIGIFGAHNTTALATDKNIDATAAEGPASSPASQSASPSSAATTDIATKSATSSSSAAASASAIDEANNKEKRQIDTKETQLYPNHRTESELDDPEVAQETIYGPKPPPNQFIIRAVSPHHHHQHEEHQDPQLLRNYQTDGQRSQSANQQQQQQLEQSQEIQHYTYLQDLSRNHPKISSKSRGPLVLKKGATKRAQIQYSKPDEAEQRYAVTIQAPIEQPQYREYQAQPQYQQEQQQQQQQQLQQQQQQQQQYQIIPEEQFLKLIEQELQARAYHDEQLRQHQQKQRIATSKPLPPVGDRSGKGLSNYRNHPPPAAAAHHLHHQSAPPPPSGDEQSSLAPTSPSQYVQYVPRHRGGPKYLPLSPQQQQQQQQHYAEPAEPAPELPPQIAYYQPQITYKTLPNHPLAKSSLEKEIEKLIATNHPSSIQVLDNSNEPSAVVNHHYQPQSSSSPSSSSSQSQSQSQSENPQILRNRSPKSYTSNATPNTSLLDANNQPFVPSLFRFSNYQTPTPIYPTQIPQHIVEAKKLGPVVYPTQTSTTTTTTTQQSQYYYQEAAPNPKTKSYTRTKHYDIKLLSPSSPSSSPSSSLPSSSSTPQLKQREKHLKIPSESTKYTQPLVYDFGSSPPLQHHHHQLHQQPQPQPQHQHQHQHHHHHNQNAAGQSDFLPSPPDPRDTETSHPTQAAKHHSVNSDSFRQYSLPSAIPSQSSIYVSQGTGITTPSRPKHVQHIKPKTIEDVKQLRLPQPGGKPLTQAEFQALVDAGYPVTAVPVPVPVPYEQYFKDHPEYRNQPVDYAQIMRNAHQQYATRQSASRLAAPSEQNVKIVSPPPSSEQQGGGAGGAGGGSITYLRPIGDENQRRHPRDNEKETEIAGEKKTELEKDKNK